MRIEKNFVTFLSPGTFLNEETTKEIEEWDVKKAVKMSKDVVERYGARPYAFYFTTRAREDYDLDSKEIAHSGRYFLGGEVKTLEQVERECNPKDDILLQNMRNNNYDKIIVTPFGNSCFFGKEDVLLRDLQEDTVEQIYTDFIYGQLTNETFVSRVDKYGVEDFFLELYKFLDEDPPKLMLLSFSQYAKVVIVYHKAKKYFKEH